MAKPKHKSLLSNTHPGFESLQMFAYALIFVFLGIGLAIPATHFLEMWKSDLGQMDATSFAQLGVFVALFFWTIRWIDATRNELNLWLKWTDIDEPREATAALVAVALYLGLSMAFVARPVLLCGYFFLGTSICIWTQWLCDHQFANARSKSAEMPIPESMKVYWLRRPQCLRVVYLTFFAGLAFAFALTGWRWNKGHGAALTRTAYWILVGEIVVAEVQITNWRRTRDKGVDAKQLKTKTNVPGYKAVEGRLQGFVALLPVMSFFGQLYFSICAGTFTLMLHHPTVMYADWVLIPFNYLAVRVIDWQRGATLYIIACISTCLVIATHAIWQIQGTDPGHMIAKSGVVLPAGWIHIVFSSAEMILLVAFVFCRRIGVSTVFRASAFGIAYFVAMAVGGYMIHGRMIPTDAVVFGSGVFFLICVPAAKKFGSLKFLGSART